MYNITGYTSCIYRGNKYFLVERFIVEYVYLSLCMNLYLSHTHPSDLYVYHLDCCNDDSFMHINNKCMYKEQNIPSDFNLLHDYMQTNLKKSL